MSAKIYTIHSLPLDEDTVSPLNIPAHITPKTGLLLHSQAAGRECTTFSLEFGLYGCHFTFTALQRHKYVQLILQVCKQVSILYSKGLQ